MSENLQSAVSAVRHLHRKGYYENKSFWRLVWLLLTSQEHALEKRAVCVHCRQIWPCATIRVLEENEA